MNENAGCSREALLFAQEVKAVATRNDIPVATANQIALSLLRDGMPEPDMWHELDAWCRIWQGRIKG